MTDQRNTIRPGPLPRDGTEISTHNRSGFESSSGREMDVRKMSGRMQGSCPPWRDAPSFRVEEVCNGRSVPIRDGTKNSYWHNRRAGPHRYLAHRRLKEIDAESIFSCRDGTFCLFVQKRKGRSVPIRNGTTSEFACLCREGPCRNRARRCLKGFNIGSSPPVRDGTIRIDVGKRQGSSVPVPFAGMKYISTILLEDPGGMPCHMVG